METQTPSLRDLNKARVRQRIVESAIALVTEHGLDDVTADAIAADANVGRATFFRYFESKETAVIAGFLEQRLTALVTVLDAAPRDLAPMDAVIWTFRELAERFDQQLKLVRLHSRLIGSSALLRARTLEFYSRYEQAIAGAVAPRFGSLPPGDLRPRLLAAAVLAVVQVSVEHWAASKNKVDLGDLLSTALQHLDSGFAKPESRARA
jgi:AcrR family transcriptional regulator